MLNHENMPGAGSLTETLEFMRKMWGGMGAPAMGIPSLSVDEINKKIADLKTVASWLELNMNMLRATIQTMEVQSATLSTLQAMGAILAPQPGQEKKAAAPAAAPFDFFKWPEQVGKPASALESEPQADDAAAALPEDVIANAAPADDASSAAAPETGKATTTPDYQAAMANPNAWWNLLQEQFQQAVGSVLAEQESAPKKAPPATAKTAKASASVVKTPAPKKTTKAKVTAKAGTRAKSTAVQSRPSKSVSRKPKSP